MESGDVNVSDWLSAAADGLTSITEEAGKLVDATPALEMFNLDQMAKDELGSEEDEAVSGDEVIEHLTGPNAVDNEESADPTLNTEQQSDWDWTPVKREEEKVNRHMDAITELGGQNQNKGEHVNPRKKLKQKTSTELDFFGFGPNTATTSATDRQSKRS